MSFLLGDDYDTGSSSSDAESDADDAQQRQLQAETARDADHEAKPAVVLPSADSILSSVSTTTASFLAPKKSDQSEALSIGEIDRFKEEEKAKADKAAENKRNRVNEAYAPKDATGKKRVASAAPESAAEPPVRGGPKKEKKDAKERVKAQRTKGQAGIGSDFRSWKSETEMHMRQQFD